MRSLKLSNRNTNRFVRKTLEQPSVMALACIDIEVEAPDHNHYGAIMVWAHTPEEAQQRAKRIVDSVNNHDLATELLRSCDANREEILTTLDAAVHAMESYRCGNASPALAKSILAAVAKVKGEDE